MEILVENKGLVIVSDINYGTLEVYVLTGSWLINGTGSSHSPALYHSEWL